MTGNYKIKKKGILYMIERNKHQISLIKSKSFLVYYILKPIKTNIFNFLSKRYIDINIKSFLEEFICMFLILLILYVHMM